MRLLMFLFVLIGMVCSPTAFARERSDNPSPGESIVMNQDFALAATRSVFQSELIKLADQSDLEILQVELDQAVQSGAGKKGDLSIRSTSCTASATVGVPGVGEVTISATASTCEEAVAQVVEGVRAIMELAE